MVVCSAAAMNLSLVTMGAVYGSTYYSTGMALMQSKQQVYAVYYMLGLF